MIFAIHLADFCIGAPSIFIDFATPSLESLATPTYTPYAPG